MQLKARLVHADAGARVVEVSAWHEGQCLGRALGEAADAETAEERAIERLQRRLNRQAAPSDKPEPLPQQASPAAPAQAAVAPAPAPPPVEPPADPDDWSDELAELDLELQRIGWGREQEEAYLRRVFDHPSRSRLTSYRDLSAYLKAVKQLQPGSDPNSAPVPLRRSELLSQSDQLLQSLRWDANRGRSFLEQHFQLASRQQLSDEQLLHFNMLLEGELLENGQSHRLS